MDERHEARFAEVLAAEAAAAIDLERLQAVLVAAADAYERALTLEANGHWRLRDAYDRVISDASGEVAAAQRDVDRASGRLAGTRRALQSFALEVAGGDA
jgi:hypothetical protein